MSDKGSFREALSVSSETNQQQAYYSRTAKHYDAMHLHPVDEHGKALNGFMGLAEVFAPVDSVLDVGAGTGRALEKLRARWPGAKVTGIEPVEELRRIGHSKGIPEDQLVSGDALRLAFEDNSFDFVIETGALHHIRTPIAAVKEMIRVARKGVMVSDSNNVGQGTAPLRFLKFALSSFGLWPAAVFLETRGKMYKVSEGDGVYYSFSAFDCVSAMRNKFPAVHYMNTTNAHGFNLYRGATHVMIFACKQ
jgi:ubiquinone/menaquinone biosynthesis C-methylase UbiE